MASKQTKVKNGTAKKPRIKEEHRFLLKKISDGIRNGKTMGEVMLELGYSESYAKNPNHLKETASWQALTEEQLPDELLTNVHKGLLTHKEWRARDAGLDKAYKIKKKYDTTINIKGAITQLSDAEVENRIAELLSGVIGSLAGEGQTGKE